HHLLADLDHLVCTERSFEVQVRTALVTAAPEDFHQPLKTAVQSFVTPGNGSGVHLSHPRNFFREFPVPKFPSQLGSQLFRDFTRAATVLAFDGDGPKHGGVYFTVSRPWVQPTCPGAARAGAFPRGQR